MLDNRYGTWRNGEHETSFDHGGYLGGAGAPVPRSVTAGKNALSPVAQTEPTREQLELELAKMDIYFSTEMRWRHQK